VLSIVEHSVKRQSFTFCQSWVTGLFPRDNLFNRLPAVFIAIRHPAATSKLLSRAIDAINSRLMEVESHRERANGASHSLTRTQPIAEITVINSLKYFNGIDNQNALKPGFQADLSLGLSTTR
jgi:hypothetical protein